MTKEEAKEYAKKMTYRDAINNLMKARSIPYRKATFIKVNELLNALEQEPCEDAISRQAAIEAAMQDVNDRRTHGFNAGATRAANRIKLLPPVKPQEPKTGHWKRISMDKYSEHAKYWYRCDRCGKDNLGNTDWCPHCGARMVEPQESEDKE